LASESELVLVSPLVLVWELESESVSELESESVSELLSELLSASVLVLVLSWESELESPLA
jgi:hypothetical protein